MTSFIKKTFAILSLSTLILVSLFGICKEMTAINQMGHDSNMSFAVVQDCTNEAVACFAAPRKDHMGVFSDLYPMIMTTGLVLVLIQVAILLVATKANWFAIQWENLRQRLKFKFEPDIGRYISPPYLQLAFSQGILNPKLDA